MTINIDNETEFKFDFNYTKLIETAVLASLDDQKCPYEAEVNLLLINDEEIKEINREYRNIDSATDVLSFPMVEYKEAGCFSTIEESNFDFFSPESGELILGDIVISIEKASKQSLEYGHSLERELAFLVVHSMLHLFGYDHILEDERLIMEEKQKTILEKLNILR